MGTPTKDKTTIKEGKLLSLILRFLPIVFLLGVCFVFASPYFLDARVPYPSDYQVNHFGPWNAYQEWWGPVKNNAMPDIIDQIYPWRHFTIQEWKGGSIPFWNPNSFSGNPHIGNFQSAAFSPFNLLFFILPFIDAWSVMVFSQPLIAGLGMFFLLRSYKVSHFGALIGAVSFMFSGFLVVWMAYGTLAMAISVLPLLLYAVNRFIDTGLLRFGFLLSFLLTFSFFAGHFQTSLYLLLFSGVYFIALTSQTKEYKRSMYLAGFFLLGLVISLLQLFPTIQFYLLSPRGESYISGGGIPWNYLITLIAPDFYGNPVTRNDWYGYYAEWASFIGVIPLVFALLTFFSKKTFIIKFLWYAIGVILILVVSSPVQSLLGNLHIPVLSTSNPSRIVVLLSFCLTFLAGFGVDRMLSLIKDKKKKEIVSPLLLVGCVIGGIVSLLFFAEPFTQEHTNLALKNMILPTVFFVVFLVSIVFSYLLKHPRFAPFSFILVVLVLVSFDSLRFAMKWMPYGERELVFADLPVLSAMQENIGHGRVFGNLGAQVNTYYNLPMIEGYDPLYIDRYGHFVNGSQDGLFHSSERSVVKVPRNGQYTDRLLDIVGVTLVFHPIADTNQSWAYPVWSDVTRFEEVYKDDYFQLFRNKTAIPRGSLFYSYEVIPNDREALKRLYDDDFNFRHTLILETDPKIEIDTSSTSSGSVTFVKDEPTHIIFDVNTRSAGLLFLSDNYYPGWKAYVNGEETRIMRADYTFRAVEVPRGTSRVEFRYGFELGGVSR